MNIDSTNINGLDFPVFYRPDSNDVETANFIFTKSPLVLKRGFFSPKTIDSFEPKFIIDGGAYAGYSSIFFSLVYPDARVAAVEPESDNFELLKMNVEHYPKIKPLNLALWSHETQLEIVNPDQETDSFMTQKISDPENQKDRALTQSVTIEQIFKASDSDFIDILKLNVNGAEREIFSEDSHYQSWLPYTKVLIIELHDRMKRDCSHNFFHAISWYDYFFMQAEDNLIFIREDLL